MPFIGEADLMVYKEMAIDGYREKIIKKLYSLLTDDEESNKIIRRIIDEVRNFEN